MHLISAVLCTLNSDVQTVDLVIPGYLQKVYVALLSLIRGRLVKHDKGGWGGGGLLSQRVRHENVSKIEAIEHQEKEN